ncbi:unnamed protein product [Acanthoscelides obtectus]|uniref:Protein transport protein sec16 n=1 Tax=Acanthoscelides obtectus TaxID=200917 RepID=A0A9P0PCE9_ACAOB|nr:unnamed protein product [Acanthoscelides obtectus]CAK1632484.1 Protein transport protein Sec16A [Acanthoscelides obtectus]
MSWMKKKHAGTPSPAVTPPVQMYNPNQHESQWHNQQVHDNWYNQSQQQQQPPQHNLYQQQVPNQEQQMPQNYYQHYHAYNQQYGQQQQPYQQNQQQQQSGAAGYYQNTPNYNSQQPTYGNMQYSQTYDQNNVFGEVQQQDKTEKDAWGAWEWGDEDNSNVQQQQQQNSVKESTSTGAIDDAFANDESWNWGVEDSKPIMPQAASHVPPTPTDSNVQELFPLVGQATTDSVKPENDCNVPSKMPVMQDSMSKRGKLETPQWSTESQMSQESSDDVVHTSEKEIHMMMSHSAAVGYTLPTQAQPQIEDPTSKPEPSYDQQQFENKEIVPTVPPKANATPPLPPKVNATIPPPPVNTLTPSLNTQTPPLNTLPPPGTFGEDSNPYKRNTALSHKTVSKFRTANVSPAESRQNFGYQQQVNLETPPDNSEQPDPVPPGQSFVRVKPTSSLTQHRPENNEAPLINDRNQYLETGQLSEPLSGDYTSESPARQESDTLPPPGLKRMVLGQTEGVGNIGVGQSDDISSQYLRRMVPGESSSPEQRRVEDDDSEAEFEHIGQTGSVSSAPQPPRSATIGADTPPAVTAVSPPSTNGGGGRSAIIGAQDGVAGRSRGVRSDKPQRKPSKESDSTRRDSIEGQTQDPEVSNLSNSVRNLIVNESLADDRVSNTSHADSGGRRLSRQESSDSERENISLSRGQRDRQSSERGKRDKDRDKDKPPRDRDRERTYDRRRYKERRYEEDTDYYSDKEKERRQAREDRDREYEKKYASLRREKDKDRRRKDGRDHRGRGEYYYGSRFEDDYDNERSSRPSSRSDSMHDSYRDRGHEKDYRDRRHRDKYKRHRDPRESFNPYQGFAYDPYNPYYQQYQYYENLRRTNPQAYAEWYRKYYQQAAGSTASYGGEDRASVHSGRSSANDELAKERYMRQSFYNQSSAQSSYYGDMRAQATPQYGLDSSSYSRPYDQTDNSLLLDDSSMNVQRLTPAKFATAHLKASITSGRLLRVLPHYPMDGQNATVELCHMNMLLADDEGYKELSEFPGPLVKGTTHKKTIIEYCENKIKNASHNQDIVDAESYILMWELLILLVRQNGMVVGTDIAELLLKNRRVAPPRPPSVLSTTSSNAAEANLNSEASNNAVSKSQSVQSLLKEEEVTNKFREYLLYGSGKEALEWAMKHGLWGHALFLASKLDKRTYANVMMRFANGLTLNDPLQTLYQLLSGKMPAAVSCVADEKWGDWRPHLAMILSNSTQRPELNCKAITALGDTLRGRGNLYAAQFCYLMAETGFGSAEDPEARLVLLGSDHRKTPYPLYATAEAIHMTEIYEYACGLNDPGFVIPQFQVYKYFLSTRLADYGLLEKSLNYLEKISNFITLDPASMQQSFVDNVCELADRLKFHDPIGEEVLEDESQFGGGGLETNRPDHSWLKELRAVQDGFRTGVITHQVYQEPDLTLNTYDSGGGNETWQSPVDQQYQTMNLQQQSWQQDSLQGWQQQEQSPNQQSQQTPVQQDTNQQQQNEFSQNLYQQQQQQNYWPNQQQWSEQTQNQYVEENAEKQQNYYGSKNAQAEEQAPQISLPNQKQRGFEDREDETVDKKASPVKPKPQSPSKETTQSTGWFGGIFSRLAMKPKNQMKLPDDKNPKIVWDQDKKRWVNIDEDPNDPANEIKPPPKMADLMPNIPPAGQQNPSGFQQMAPAPIPNATQAVVQQIRQAPLPDDNGNLIPKGPPQPNIFKMQRSRNLKNSYVDVFSQGGAAKPAPTTGPAPVPAPAAPMSTVQPMNFFIPQPMGDPNAPVDFLTPGGVPHMGEQQKRKSNDY